MILHLHDFDALLSDEKRVVVKATNSISSILDTSTTLQFTDLSTRHDTHIYIYM